MTSMSKYFFSYKPLRSQADRNFNADYSPFYTDRFLRDCSDLLQPLNIFDHVVVRVAEVNPLLLPGDFQGLL